MSEPPLGVSPFAEPPEDPAYRLWLAKKREWWQWHNDNPEVWNYFQQFAFQAINRGRAKISHWLIMNRIRWEVFLPRRRPDHWPGVVTISRFPTNTLPSTPASGNTATRSTLVCSRPSA